jgi:hypothetical protein
MKRRNTKRMLFIVSGATLLAVALIAGAALFALPKITAANVGPASQAATNSTMNSAVHTIQATTTTNHPAQVAQQPTAVASPQASPTVTGNGQQKTTTTVNQSTSTSSTMPAAASSLFVEPLKQYGFSIQSMVAQGLNISNTQLATQLQASKHLTDIAQAQGVSSNQLQTLLATSIQSSFGPAIQNGQLTQAQVSSFVLQTQQNPVMLEPTLSVTPPKPAAHW